MYCFLHDLFCALSPKLAYICAPLSQTLNNQCQETLLAEKNTFLVQYHDGDDVYIYIYIYSMHCS